LLGKEHVYTAGEAIVWAAALRPACAARAALLEKLLTRLKGKDVKIRG
jgi:predicted hydrocarbon binding protein